MDMSYFKAVLTSMAILDALRSESMRNEPALTVERL